MCFTMRVGVVFEMGLPQVGSLALEPVLEEKAALKEEVISLLEEHELMLLNCYALLGVFHACCGLADALLCGGQNLLVCLAVSFAVADSAIVVVDSAHVVVPVVPCSVSGLAYGVQEGL